MNTDMHLILVKGEEKTESISSCLYEDGKWQITFERGKTYSYNYLNVQWLKNPVLLDAATTIVYMHSQPVSGIAKIFDFGDYIRICFVTGYKKVYSRQEITLEQSCLIKSDANNCFEYLKQLADKVGVTDEDDRSFLGKQYEKINFVSPGSVLAKYVSPTELGFKQLTQMPIFPFGFNLSQKEATEKALTEQLSVIEGPPGTGKTQTILNIIANAIINGKTVAVISFSFYKNPHENIIALFQKLYYERRTKELEKQIQALTDQLESYQFERAMQDYIEISMKLFKAKLAERFKNRTIRSAFTKDSLWKDSGSFLKEYPLILSTTHSLRSCANTNYLFDYVIMDEASQVDIVTGALALSCAKNAVIVGDDKQLPNVVSSSTAEETSRIFKKFSLHSAYHYAENSMLSSIIKLFNNVPRTLLIEHYRCHPKIIGFCNQKFYNNELIVLTEENGRDKPLLVYKTAKGNHARGHYNQRQIDVIMQEILPERGIDDSKQSVGIISPYRSQKDKMKDALGERNIEVDTVHKYQGRERDVVILTTVVNEVNEFVDDPNLINVAVSRAVDQLIVVVSNYEKNDSSNIGDLIKYIEYNNFEIINSAIYSVFDLLYHSYSRQLFESMKKRKHVSKYDSENLMNAVIEKVLNQSDFQNLGHVMHQPLKMLIRDPKKLDEAECRFAMNVLTHTDFVIFNKLDKMPVLVVEVDGYAFHANNPKQLERDKMKDTILEKYGIPILRIKTNESGEELRLHEKLSRILKIN